MFFFGGLKVTDGWASWVFLGLVLGVQGYRHEANGVLGRYQLGVNDGVCRWDEYY